MTLPQFCLAYIESRIVWAGFKPPLPPKNARFTFTRFLLFTLGQIAVGAILGWGLSGLVGLLSLSATPTQTPVGRFTWLIWFFAAFSACQGIIGYGFTALCWNQRAARLQANRADDLSLKPTRFRVFRSLLGLVYFVLFALIAPAALLWTFENARAELLWRMERSRLVAQGEKLDFQELAGPPIPPEQNAGAAPVFEPFFNYRFDPDKMGTGFHSAWFESNELQRIESRVKIPSLVARETSKSSKDELQTPAVNLSEWAAAYRHLVSETNKTRPSWAATLKLPADTNDVARTVLAGLAVAHEEIAEVCDASARPRSQFPIHFEEGFNALLRHLGLFKSIQIHLELRCAAHLRIGETNNAFEDAQCGLRVAELLREEPALISQLVRYAQSAIAVRTIWQGLAEHSWSDAQVASLQKELSTTDYLPGLELAFEGERACGIESVDGWISKGMMLQQTSPDQTGPIKGFSTRLLSRGILRQNELALTRYYQRMLTDIRDAISNAPASGLSKFVSNIEETTERTHRDLTPFSPYKAIAAMTAPAAGRSAEKTARAQTIVKLAEVACALERYHLRHGAFPETLDQLAPGILSTSPLDPMNNEPFHYRRTDDGWYLLYSVGLNGQDDGGEFLVMKGKKSEQLDWPWPVPSRPAKKNLF